jgi:hypothetical protein
VLDCSGEVELVDGFPRISELTRPSEIIDVIPSAKKMSHENMNERQLIFHAMAAVLSAGHKRAII